MTIPAVSTRTADVGGPVAKKVHSQGFQLYTSRLVILIHGYNNDKQSAMESYSHFLKHIGLDKVSIIGQICGFLWPGDKNWGLLSMFSYPFEMGPAKEAAKLLHNFLIDQSAPGGWPLDIMLICHSLGNRVGLELIHQNLVSISSEKLRYSAGCFMAAAVPVFKVEEGGDLREAAKAVKRKIVLFSSNDTVLQFAFPIGQTFAGTGEGIFPRAVGRLGQPNDGLWTARADMGIYNYTHSDYWVQQESADTIAAFLGLAFERIIRKAAIENRETPTQTTQIDRLIPERQIPDRTLRYS